MEHSNVSVMFAGRLRVEVYPSRPAMGAAAAAVVAQHLRDTVARDGQASLILASAPSQNEFLAVLRDAGGIRWEQVTAFHLDEYLGVSEGQPASFRRFLLDRLISHVPIKAFYGLDGLAADPDAECARYAALLRLESPSLAVLGIGENGHLAFIDPPICDFFDPAIVRTVTLDDVCRTQQVHDGCFPTLDEVPRQALSLTVPYLMQVPRAVAIVPGPRKQAAVQSAVHGPVTTACPASILQRHTDATLFLDTDSAATLGVSRGG